MSVWNSSFLLLFSFLSLSLFSRFLLAPIGVVASYRSARDRASQDLLIQIQPSNSTASRQLNIFRGHERNKLERVSVNTFPCKVESPVSQLATSTIKLPLVLALIET